jgi:glycosyltransferase involved in cell wall biosynthesis
MCIHPLNPTIEAFGQTYVEALAAGIPSIFTMSGVAPEFVEHEKNAMVVDFKDQNGIYNSVSRLLADKDLSERMVKNGKRDVQRFELGNMISKLEKALRMPGQTIVRPALNEHGMA